MGRLMELLAELKDRKTQARRGDLDDVHRWENEGGDYALRFREDAASSEISPDYLAVDVWLRPRSASSGVGGSNPHGVLLVRVTERAVDGRAEASLRKIIGRAFEVGEEDVTIVSGRSNPRKALRVRGGTPEQLLKLLALEPSL